MSGLNKSVLIVEDQHVIAMGFSVQIEDMGLEVCAIADTAERAVAYACLHRPAVILMDMRLRGILRADDEDLTGVLIEREKLVEANRRRMERGCLAVSNEIQDLIAVTWHFGVPFFVPVFRGIEDDLAIA